MKKAWIAGFAMGTFFGAWGATSYITTKWEDEPIKQDEHGHPPGWHYDHSKVPDVGKGPGDPIP